ncbi:LysR family transcriptional regulator [Winogradskyella bathintestinalis]|uniref:LysR substrate-binding domain-containing protein n=1 Tax=Winogradskyella bathintestinalis TaxID=3035208 RepID=A0ABT7ZYS5_9FLAO|nr:LysR substrate-binding domain-containing protein [Winogradskyella bathintestinalis]MDN3494160.1 LysR substrate-binding domain-containing protein [Winogradskyella bathintestinalis]
MTIQQIKYFLVLAKELHFWNTAEKVFISQSSLSRQIQALEDELQIQLFERDKRNVKLTNAGKFLQEQWREEIKEFDQIIRQAKKIDEGKAGTISITYPGSIAYEFLPKFLEVLSNNLPDLKIELTEPTDENHEKLLLNFQTDIAFSRDKIKNANIDSQKLYSEPICLVVPKNHRLNKKNLTGLENEKFIISGLHQTTFFASLLRSWFSKNGIEPKTIIESDFGGMIMNLVSKGLGISILPLSFKSAQAENVEFIELEEKIDLYINWRKKELNNTIKKVIELAENVAKK